MKAFRAILLILILIITSAAIPARRKYQDYLKTTDTYIRDRVMLLYSAHGSCTGIQIKAPSGALFILSAGHCTILAEDSIHIQARNESGEESTVEIVAVDEEHDLLLLSPANNLSVDVAKSISKHEAVHTMSHGLAFPSYRTDGELLEEREIEIMLFPIVDQTDEDKCQRDPNTRVAIDLESMSIVCTIRFIEMMTTAPVMPGSSGGPALDSSGKLIGIISVSQGNGWSGIVPLHFIQDFLKGR